jgi:hypothetical protein
MLYGPYSPSRLDTAKCPYSFYLQYVDPNRSKERPQGNLAQERGSALHEVLEHVTIEMVRDRDVVITADQLKQWTKEAILRHPTAYQETEDILSMAKLYIERPPKMLTRDAQTELRLAVKYEGGKFVECGYDEPEAVARGRADIFMVSDDLTVGYVIDHKTQPNIETADTAQMGFYAWVLSKIHPYLKEIRTVLHFARYGAYSEEFVWTLPMLADVEDSVLTKIQIIEETENWVAIPHDHCQYCPYLLTCPALQQFVQKTEDGYRVTETTFKILGDTGKAVQFAGLSHLIEEVQKQVKKELRDHVKKNGPVAIPGRVYEFRPEVKIHWDAINKTLRQQTYDVFKKYGLDERTFMSFNQTTSQAIWLIDNTELVRELSELFPKKCSTEFGAHKI